MQSKKLIKGFVFAVIILFIGVCFQPVLASDTISPIKKSDTKELLETIKDLADNKEIQDIIQKSEIKGSPIRFQQLLVRLQKEIISAIEKNNELNERLKQLPDLPCDCEKDNSVNWSFPVLCTFLFPIVIILIVITITSHQVIPLLEILMKVGLKLHCFWYLGP